MLGYRAALQWLLDNDDTEWVSDPDASNSVTSAFLADIYGKPDHKVKADLIRLANKQAPFPSN